MTAAQLRQALDQWHPDDPLRNNAMLDDIVAAARSWLNLLEADETTIDKVAGVLLKYQTEALSVAEGYRAAARAVLAAIVGEET